MGFLAGTSGHLPEITCQAPSDHFKDGRSVKSLVEDLYHKRVAVDADFLALDVVGAGPKGRLGQTLPKGRNVTLVVQNPSSTNPHSYRGLFLLR